MLAAGWIQLALGLIVASGADDANKRELARFEGVWSFSRVVVDGASQSKAQFPANEIVILKDGRYAVAQGPRITHGVITLDPTTSPKHFDSTITDGVARGRTFTAIYALNGDTYRYCGSLRGKERPTALASAPGSGTMLQVLKREKGSARDAMAALYRRELTGTWLAVSFERDGTSASEDELKAIKLVIDGEGKTTSLIGGKVFLAGGSTIDPTQDPMTLDVAYTEGVSKGKSTLGIFKLEDGALTVCRRSPGQPRPTEFGAAAGSGQILIRYRRETSEAAK